MYTKPRILIPLTIQFSVRYVVRTGLLEKISNYCTPIIALGWEDAELCSELSKMGCMVVHLPQVRMSKKFARLRKKIHLAHFDNISSCTTNIDRRRYFKLSNVNQKLKGPLRNFLYRAEYNLPGRLHSYYRMENELIGTETNLNEFRKNVSEIKPDAYFCLTPYYIEEEFLSRAVSEITQKLCVAILSFDNLTTRPRIPILFHTYLLWNEINKNELLRIYPQTQNQQVRIVGAPQFDFYHDSSFLWSEDVWRTRLTIPPDRPVILYGAGPEIIAPPEPHWLAQLDSAIEKDEIIGNPIILLRRHPVDSADRWKSLGETSKNIIFDAPWHFGKENAAKTNIHRDNIEKLVSTLYHSQVHINASSTMTIDGAIFDKPQIGPAYDDRPGMNFNREMKELYKREHYLPITNSGGLEIANSRHELIRLVNNAFSNPGRLNIERQKMVQNICTYDDGKATLRVVEELISFIGK